MSSGKLVRDKIPEILRAEGVDISVETLGEEAFREALRRKLAEETMEYLEAGAVEELADILEVVYALAASVGVEPGELEALKKRKREARGGFEQRYWLTVAPGANAVPDGGTPPAPLTLKALQEQVQSLKRSNGWPDQTLDRRAVYLMSEVGEIAKELIHLAYAKDDEQRAAARERLGLEIYDAVWNLCDLAYLAGIDLESAFAAKNALNQRRRW